MLQLMSAGPMIQARVLVSGRHGPFESILPLPAILDGIFTSMNSTTDPHAAPRQPAHLLTH
jgi:hypothetical protein